MSKHISLIVQRADDRVVILVPEHDDVRTHAVVTEDEAYCACNAIRRMSQARERRILVIGSDVSGLRIERVDHACLPIELHFDDDDGTTIVDLSKDDALCLADLLWGAHRAGASFYAMASLVGGIRRRERITRTTIIPRPEIDFGDTRIVGDLKRRRRGQDSEPKS